MKKLLGIAIILFSINSYADIYGDSKYCRSEAARAFPKTSSSESEPDTYDTDCSDMGLGITCTTTKRVNPHASALKGHAQMLDYLSGSEDKRNAHYTSCMRGLGHADKK
jgi:hypothetical protein